MKIAVTGATGFIGNHVIDCLIKEGHSIIASSSNSQNAEKESWFKSVKYIPYKIDSFISQNNLFEYFNQPDALIHLAWQGLPNYHSLHHIEENLMSGYFFLKNMVTNGLKNLTVAGTCLEYGMKSGKLSEDLNPSPVTSYGIGKYSLFSFLKLLNEQTPFSLKWTRLFYTYGPGQNPNSLFPQLEQAIINKATEFMMSGGEQIRDFYPVEKLASAIVQIAKQERITGAINCCSGTPVKVKDFVTGYLESKGETLKLHLGFYPYLAYEPMEFWGDNSKLLAILK
ncbi:MAG: NAD-dependent epimerase/dehydratase family protein [Bacteroidia bacterium]|nr:NAD-dependent epimerase/dehydratase family protein [Bacteroidia bacterium]